MVIFSQLINTLSKLGIFIALMQIGNASVAGSYTLSLAVVTPVFLMFGFSLREIYVTHRESPTFIDFLKLRTFAGLGGIACSTLIGFIFYADSFGVIVAMSIYRFTELLVDIRGGHFQRHGQFTLMAYLTIALAVSTATTIVAVFYLTHSLIPSILAGSFSAFIVFCISNFKSIRKKESSNTTKNKKLKSSSIYYQGFMLSTSAFAVSFGTNVPVLLIGSFHSPATVGIYSSIYNIMSVSNILFSSITQVELKEYAGFAKNSEYKKILERGRKVVFALTSIAVFGAAIIIFAGQPILALAFNQDFAGQQLALSVMAATICVTPLGFILDAQLTAMHKFSTQGKLSLLTLIFTVIVSFLLIPSLGILGGTLVVFLTMVVRNIAKLTILKKAVLRAA